MKRSLFLQPDVSAGTAWDPFRLADPVPCERPKTKKGRPARQPVLPVSSLGSGGDLHAPNHAAGTDNASGIAFFPGRIPDDA